MYVRNLLKAGQFVTLVPVGLPITLQYDKRGILERAFVGHDDTRVNAPDAVVTTITQYRNAPIKIPLQGGTTWVKGVLYSGKLFPVSGKLPDAAIDHMIKDLEEYPESYQFYAGDADSTATRFVGATATRQWLNSAKFSILPGFLVPPNMNPALFKSMCESARFQFKSMMVQSYMLFDARAVTYPTTGMKQVFVGTVTTAMNDLGHLMSTLTYKGLPDKLVVSYKQTYLFNIHPNSLLVLDNKGKIIHHETTDSKNRVKRSDELVCSACGRPYKVDLHSADVCCPNEHCISRMYPRVKHLLDTLHLPVIEYSVFKEAADAKKILTIADVFELDQYKELEIEATVFQMVRGVMSIMDIPYDDILELFCNKCSNRISTIKYYAEHPESIAKDLKIAHLGMPRLIDWLSDVENVADLESVFDLPNIKITGVDRMFNGQPILRGKNIMITGKFAHGKSGDIARILQSYSARVVYDLVGRVDCVVVGDLQEDVNSSAIRNARANQVPVMSEAQFFEQFKIDEDLQEHLK